MILDEEPMASLTQYQQDFRRRFARGLADVPGRVTSYWRSADKNRAVGGAASSQHLYGLAADIVVASGWKNRATKAARNVGLTVIDEGDHLHLQYFRADRRPSWLR